MTTPYDGARLNAMVVGALRGADKDHPGSSPPQWRGSVSKRIVGMLMSATKDSRVDAYARIAAQQAEIRRLRRESYWLHFSLRACGVASGANWTGGLGAGQLPHKEQAAGSTPARSTSI